MPKFFSRQFRFSMLTDFSHWIMDWIGSVSSLLVHTLLFGVAFSLVFLGFNADKVLLIITTLVSLEAIYLAIFIQMAVNQNIKSLTEVEEDIDEIQEDVDEIQKDVDEIQEDVEEIQKEDEEEEQFDVQNKRSLEKIEGQLQNLISEIEAIKNIKRPKKTAAQEYTSTQSKNRG